MNRSRPFDALGLAVAVEAEDAKLRSYVERLYASFPEPERASHRYTLHDDAAIGATLWFDDDRVGDAEVLTALVATLVHDLTSGYSARSEGLEPPTF